ncbi:MAG: DUF2635 domain-containing protein [Azonexus sp.]|jgi:hypothetical protein|nr:DUF2635 domain-containing protein [Azonexus sp.]
MIVIATPVNNARVRKPDGQILKPAGERVLRSSYWLRREQDGDVRLQVSDAPAPALPRERGKGKTADT